MRGSRGELEGRLSLLLAGGTYLSIGLLVLGVGAMVLAGRAPLEPGFAPFDLTRLPEQLASGRAEGFLWLGLVAALATPALRVVGALVGFAARRETALAAVALAILAVIALAIALAATGV